MLVSFWLSRVLRLPSLIYTSSSCFSLEEIALTLHFKAEFAGTELTSSMIQIWSSSRIGCYLYLDFLRLLWLKIDPSLPNSAPFSSICSSGNWEVQIGGEVSASNLWFREDSGLSQPVQSLQEIRRIRIRPDPTRQ